MRLLIRASPPGVKVTSAQRVLIVGTGAILEDGIRGILQSDARLQVSNLVFTTEAAFLETLLNIYPEVVILNKQCRLSFARIFELISGASKPIGLRILVVGIDDDRIELYDSQYVRAGETRDLLTFVNRR